MTGFIALLRLQLFSRFADMKPRNLKAQLKEKKGRTVGKTLLYVFLILYLGGMLFYVENKFIDILIQVGMPEMLVTMAVFTSMMGTIIMSFFFVFSSLYLGRDAAYLASLPLKARTVMSAKLTQVWISETCIDALIILPACILYAVKTGAGAGFWIRMVPVWLLSAVIPICLITFLASLLIRISGLWKHREIIMTVGGIALLIAYMFLMMNLGGLTGNSASGGDALARLVVSSAGRIKAVTRFFPPAGWAAGGLLGTDYPMFFLWIAISLAAPVITVWLMGYSYRKLSLLQSETSAAGKKKAGKASFGSGSQMKACSMREFRNILRTPSYATNILPIVFMPLLMILMLFVFTGNSAEAGESLATLVNGLDPAFVMLILFAGMAFMAGMNPALSTAVTREGKGHGFLTALPISAKTIVGSKLLVGYGLSMCGVFAAAVALAVMFPAHLVPTLLALILCALFTFVNAVLALSRDVRKPKLDWVTEQEAVKQNFGMLISMLVSWGILVTLGILTYFLITLKLSMLPMFAVFAAILGALGYVFWRRLLKVTDQYYCAG